MKLGFIILLTLAVPSAIIWPALLWAGAIKSLYSILCDRTRQSSRIPQNQAVKTS
jgi:hypothetical protein